MSEPTRWSQWCSATHGHMMVSQPNGEFVKYEDYERLTAELSACRQERDGLQRERNEYARSSHDFDMQLQTAVRHEKEAIKRAESAESKLASTPQSVTNLMAVLEAVKVHYQESLEGERNANKTDGNYTLKRHRRECGVCQAYSTWTGGEG